MKKLHEEIIKEFNKKFGNPTAKYSGNDFAEYPKANIHDANNFIRSALECQLSKIVKIINDLQVYYVYLAKTGKEEVILKSDIIDKLNN